MKFRVMCLSRYRFAAFFVLSATLLGGCAGVQNGPPEQIVAQLANERWKALISNDFNKAYEYASPSYRAVVNLESFKGKFSTNGALHWLSAKTSKVDCQADKCDVTVDVTGVALAGASKITHTAPVSEVWVLEAGKWWVFNKF